MHHQIKSVILGHAVADALGVPVEFASREELDQNPVEDMEGFGTYPMPAGSWSDDTSMSIAALDGLQQDTIDWEQIMTNFGKWYYQDAFTPTGEMFDVGNTCSIAIENYCKHHKPLWECGVSTERANGNGSLMRIHPFSLYLYSKNNLDPEIIHKASCLTHAHKRSQIACGIYSFVLWELLRNPCKPSVRLGLSRAWRYYKHEPENQVYYKLYSKIGLVDVHFTDADRIAYPPRTEIQSGGYVVHTLEAAIWCVLTTRSYEECVLKAVNLGDDTDTVAAVAGGLAGALYGYEGIPVKWLATLKKREELEEMCERAGERWGENGKMCKIDCFV